LVIKTNDTGVEEWNNTIGEGTGIIGFDIEQTKDSGYIISGSTGQLRMADSHVNLLKLDQNGNVSWNKAFVGSGPGECYSVDITIDDGFLLTGATKSFNAMNWDIWVIKTNSNGEEDWNITFGGMLADKGLSGLQTEDGGYIISGMRDIPSPYYIGGNLFLLKLYGDDQSISILDENPPDGANDIDRPPEELKVTVEGLRKGLFDVYIRWKNHDDIWVTLNSYLSVGSGNYNYTIPVPPVSNDWIWGETTYIWSVNVTDGNNWNNKTYYFTTSGSRYDVNNDDKVNFQDAGLIWINRD